MCLARLFWAHNYQFVGIHLGHVHSEFLNYVGGKFSLHFSPLHISTVCIFSKLLRFHKVYLAAIIIFFIVIDRACIACCNFLIFQSAIGVPHIVADRACIAYCNFLFVIPTLATHNHYSAQYNAVLCLSYYSHVNSSDVVFDTCESTRTPSGLAQYVPASFGKLCFHHISLGRNPIVTFPCSPPSLDTPCINHLSQGKCGTIYI